MMGDMVEMAQLLRGQNISTKSAYLKRASVFFVVDSALQLPWFEGFERTPEVVITAPKVYASREDALKWLKVICLKVVIGSILLMPEVLVYGYGGTGNSLLFGFLAVSIGIPSNQLANPQSTTVALLAPFLALIAVVVTMLGSPDAFIHGAVVVGWIVIQSIILHRIHGTKRFGPHLALFLILSLLPVFSTLALLWQNSPNIALPASYSIVIGLLFICIILLCGNLIMMYRKGGLLKASMHAVAQWSTPIMLLALFLAILELMASGALILTTFRSTGNSTEDAVGILQQSHSSLTFGMNISLVAAITADNNLVSKLIAEISSYNKIAVKLKILSAILKDSRNRYRFDENTKNNVDRIIARNLFQPLLAEVIESPKFVTEVICMLFLDALVAYHLSKNEKKSLKFTLQGETSIVVKKESFEEFCKCIAYLEDTNRIIYENSKYQIYHRSNTAELKGRELSFNDLVSQVKNQTGAVQSASINPTIDLVTVNVAVEEKDEERSPKTRPKKKATTARVSSNSRAHLKKQIHHKDISKDVLGHVVSSINSMQFEQLNDQRAFHEEIAHAVSLIYSILTKKEIVYDKRVVLFDNTPLGERRAPNSEANAAETANQQSGTTNGR